MRDTSGARLVGVLLGHRDTVAPEEVDVPHDQQHDRGREDAGVEREEARERVRSDRVPAADELRQLFTDERRGCLKP